MEADSALAAQWETIAPHLPGALSGGLRPGAGPAAGVLPHRMSAKDARRVLNARLHLLHVNYGALCLHAVALRRPSDGQSVLLLGGHGAGKTLVALALVHRGWQVLAGDVTLLDVSGAHPAPRVLGGTTAFLARRAPTRRWFPDLVLPQSAGDRVDLGHLAGTQTAPAGTQPVTVAAVVDVDGDPCARQGVVEVLDTHTAATVWWRASGHLLERLLDDSPMVLRQFEDAPAAERRQERVRALAGALALHTVWGAPQAIASRIEDLADTTSPTPTMEVR
ncbi:hypothetical protein AB0K57_26960 [Streptomyces halstedii]|uniref:hypothetical protein n=1 Tax=Streptomyces halstedii TaxID=1944 RepID=UPI00345F7E6C